MGDRRADQRVGEAGDRRRRLGRVDEVQRDERHHRGADRGEAVVRARRSHGSAPAPGPGPAPARRPADRRRRPRRRRSRQRADDAVVAPLARPAVARAHDDGDGQQHPIAVAAPPPKRLRDDGAGDHRRGQPHGIAQHRRVRGGTAARAGADRSCGAARKPRDRPRRSPPPPPSSSVIARSSRSMWRRASSRRATVASTAARCSGVELVAGGEPRRLAPHRVGRHRMAGRQSRLGAGQQLEAEMLQVERGGAQRDADARRAACAPPASRARRAGRIARRPPRRTSRAARRSSRRAAPAPASRAAARAAARAPPATGRRAPPAGGSPRRRLRAGRAAGSVKRATARR